MDMGTLAPFASEANPSGDDWMNSLFALRAALTSRRFGLAMIALAASGGVQAMTPGSTLSYWRPEQVPGLSTSEVAYLKQAQCLIESYRDDSTATRKSATPDENDIMMLARGELAEHGKSDLAVYCKATHSKKEFLLVKWAGREQCPSELRLSEQSRFFKQHGPAHDYYGDSLRVVAPKDVLESVDEIYKSGYMETPPQQWRMSAKNVAPIKHDSLTYGGHCNLFLDCHQGKWLKLLDRYDDEID